MLLGQGGGEERLFGGVWEALGAVVVLPVLPSMFFLPVEHARAASSLIRIKTSQGRGVRGETMLGGPADASGVGNLVWSGEVQALRGSRGW